MSSSGSGDNGRVRSRSSSPEASQEKEEASSPPPSKKKKAKTTAGSPAATTIPGPTRSYWRLDAEESFSDWTVVVREEEDEQEGADGGEGSAVRAATLPTKTFHVHRVVLAYGIHRCGYFAALLRHEDGTFTESGTRTTTMDLPKLAFDAFEPFLDFLYGDESAIAVESAVPLAYLADRFDNVALSQEVRDFITEQLHGFYGEVSEGIAHKYATFCRHTSRLCPDGHIQEILIGWMCEQVANLITASHESVHDPFAEFLPSILAEAGVGYWDKVFDRAPHISFSSWAYHICKYSNPAPTKAQFEKYTSPDLFPTLDEFRYAWIVELLEAEEAILGSKCDGTATDFQQRAVDKISEHWDFCKHLDFCTKFVSEHPEFGNCVRSSAKLPL